MRTAGWLARGIALSFVVQLTLSSFTPPLPTSVWARKVEGLVVCLHCRIFVEALSTVYFPQSVLYCATYNNRRGHYTLAGSNVWLTDGRSSPGCADEELEYVVEGTRSRSARCLGRDRI
jgi:hypothetical protein